MLTRPLRTSPTVLGATLLTLGCLGTRPDPAGAELSFVHAQRAETTGLDGAIASSLSPDGRQLYVAALGADALVIFGRDEESGAVTFRRALFDNDAGLALTKGEVLPDGLSDVADVAVSPDGGFVYTAGWSDSAIGVFERFPDGDLAWRESVFDASLAGVSSIEISPDGSLLWAAAFDAAALCRFDRDATDGSLGLPPVCVVDAAALTGARGLALASGGQRALVASKTSGTLSWLDAGSTQGLQVIADGVGGVSGLDGAYALDLSAAGDDVYVASWEGGAIAHFRRAGAGYDFVAGHEVRMLPLGGIRVDPAGHTVYATENEVRLLERVERDPLDGSLTTIVGYAHALEASGMVGITGPPDGRQLYAAAVSGHVVVYRPEPGNDIALVHETGGPDMSLFGRITDLALPPERSTLFAAGDEGLVALQRDSGSGAVRLLRSVSVGGGGKSIAVSSEYVYHASAGSGTITRRNLVLSSPVDTTTSLASIRALALSPDEHNLYVLSETDQRLMTFTVGGQGALSPFGNMPIPVDVSSVAVSPDGAIVVIASHTSLVRTFARDPGTGVLSILGNLAIGSANPGTETAIAFSADSREIYVAGLEPDLLSVLTCDETTGCSFRSQIFQDGVGGVDGLEGASDVLVSTDGERVFVAGTAENAVAVFRRHQSGDLSFLHSVRSDANNFFSLVRPRALAETDQDLYVGAFGPLLSAGPSGGVAVLTRRQLFADGFETGDTSAWSAAVR